MTPDVWNRVRGLLDELMPLTADERSARLAGLRHTEPAVAAEVESLLGGAQDSEANGDTFWPPQESHTLGPVAEDRPEGLPEKVGRYEVVEAIGRGGMGSVYRVRDTLFRRTLALKILAAEFRGDASLKARFLEESQLMGQLQHPGIPPVHDMGESPDGRPYFTMKLIRGETLAQLLEARAGVERDQPRFLGIFEQVCATLAYAHAQGVIHRDLKPANIMVGAFGEVQVMDWGLGKVRAVPDSNPARGSVICTARSDAPEAATRPGSAMGTPAYMAPEQARGEVDGLDERCDVFGLGAILCEILTGEPAFVGFDVRDVLRQAGRGSVGPALTRLAKSGADADLVCLATRCLAEEREGRPADAGQVHDEVAAYLNGVQQRLRQAELAKKEADVRTAERRERRRTVARLGAVIAALLLALAAGGAWVRHVRAEREHQKSMVRHGVEARFDELDRVLASGKTREAKDHLDKIRTHLSDMEEPDLERRLAEREDDAALLGELDTLFDRRWQVMQQVVLEHVHSGKRGKGLAMGQPRLESATYTRGVTREQIRDEYAATFRKRGLDPTHSPAEEVIGRVKGSVIRAALIDALDQWFLLDAQSQPLIEVLNPLDEGRSLARRMLAARDAGKPLPADPASLAKEDPEPVAVMYLSELLPDDQAVALLKRAVVRFPDDYRSLSVLTYRLLLMRPSRPARAEEAAGYARAAHTLKPENSFACLMVAVALKASGNLDDAIRQARRAIELDETHAAAHHHLALAYSNNKQPDEAIACWKRAAALDPKHHGAHCNLGWASNEKGQYGEAIAWLSKAIALDPQCVAAHRNLGWAYKKRGQLDEAVRWYRKGVDLDPENASAYNNLGWTYNGKKEYDEAIKWLRKALALDPGHVNAHYNMGVAYGGKKDYDAAIEWYKKAVDFDPKHVDAHFSLGWTYNAKKEYDEAIEWYRKAIALDPKNVHAHNNIGLAYHRKKDYSRAVEWYEKAVVIDPKYALAYKNLGFAYKEKKEYDHSIGWFQKFLLLEPAHVNAHFNIAWAYFEKGQYDEAIAWYRKTIVLDPENVDAHNNVGLAYDQKKEYDRAIEWYEKAAGLDPKYADALFNLGMAYKEKKEYGKSVEWFRKLLLLDPEHVNAHLTLGQALYEDGKTDEAIRCWLKAAAIAPNNALASNVLAVAYKENREYARSIEWSRKAIALESKNVDAHDRLIMTLVAADRMSEAVEAVDVARRAVAKTDWLALRYNAACAYALAGCATGDATKLPPAERGRLRKQALAWLGEERAGWAALGKSADPAVRKSAAGKCRHALADDDFKGVRDPKALEKLDAEERKEWEGFWKSVRALLTELEPPPTKGK